jgi:MoaA/NifB/PqqE/SkfB family radical SAM enzyme
MDPALARAVVEERRGSGLVELIPSTMGEPLLWPGLPALVEQARAAGLLLNVTTNGTWPGRGPQAWAELLCPATRDVKISWNATSAGTAEAIMPGLAFVKALDDLAVFLDVREAVAARGGRRCTVSFQVTAQEANVEEVPGIVGLAATLGVDRVKLNQLQVRDPALAAGSLRRSPDAIARWNAAVRAARALAASIAPGRLVLENAVELAPDPDAPAPRGECPFVGREAWIRWDGRLAPYPHPAAERGELGDFGTVARRPLAELWEAAPFRAFVARWEQHPVCARCAFRRVGGA